MFFNYTSVQQICSRVCNSPWKVFKHYVNPEWDAKVRTVIRNCRHHHNIFFLLSYFSYNHYIITFNKMCLDGNYNYHAQLALINLLKPISPVLKDECKLLYTKHQKMGGVSQKKFFFQKSSVRKKFLKIYHERQQLQLNMVDRKKNSKLAVLWNFLKPISLVLQD